MHRCPKVLLQYLNWIEVFSLSDLLECCPVAWPNMYQALEFIVDTMAKHAHVQSHPSSAMLHKVVRCFYTPNMVLGIKSTLVSSLYKTSFQKSCGLFVLRFPFDNFPNCTALDFNGAHAQWGL